MTLSNQVALMQTTRLDKVVTLITRHVIGITRSVMTITPGDGDIAIYEAGRELLERALRNRRARVRLVGVGVANITERSVSRNIYDDYRRTFWPASPQRDMATPIRIENTMICSILPSAMA